jgi:uncharacterized LabA/DUF88 family protein
MRKPRAPARGTFFMVTVQRQRVISFVDGFNLYHAIAALHRPMLKWVDLRALSKVFLKSYSEELSQVLYFSAYAEHVDEVTQNCQKAHIRALELKGVMPILGHFKRKNRKCPMCDYRWIGHEEKETDVNIALFFLNLSYQDAFDRALIISNDSDLAPAIQMVRKLFPKKRITTIAPPNYYHSIDLIKVSSDKTKIRVEHLERCLLPPVVSDPSGLIYVTRPHQYMPVSMVDSF